MSSHRTEYFLSLAASIAQSSDVDGFNHGAIIVKGGKIIASGCNQTRTRLHKKNVTSAHAEVVALMNATKRQKCEKEALQC